MKLVELTEVDEVIDCLKGHGIVAFPTDTVFGLGCLYKDKEAIEKIYEAKNRSISKRLPMMVSSLEMLKEYAQISEKDEKLFKRFAPGPITFIFKLLDDSDTIAIRMPDDKWILDLIAKINKPLLVTSANISGKGSLCDYNDVKEDLGANIDMLVKGVSGGKTSSTIVDCVNNYAILREGPIKKEEIMEVIE